jgi:Na+/H+ antiporter NhaD/arsenite permease-like protein
MALGASGLVPRRAFQVVLVSIAASLLALVAYVRRRSPRACDLERLGSARTGIVDAVTFRAVWAVLAALIGGSRNESLAARAGRRLDVLGRHGGLAASLGTGLASAGLPAFRDKVPTVLIGALPVHATSAHGTVQHATVDASVVGADLDPTTTRTGSMATVPWLHVLAGSVLTPLALAAAPATPAERP